jgi:hypothetical protein
LLGVLDADDIRVRIYCREFRRVALRQWQ